MTLETVGFGGGVIECNYTELIRLKLQYGHLVM
jgi:hypothetical protein